MGEELTSRDIKSLLNIVARGADVDTRTGFNELVAEVVEVIGVNDFMVIQYPMVNGRAEAPELLDFGGKQPGGVQRYRTLDYDNTLMSARRSLESGECVSIDQQNVGEAILYATPPHHACRSMMTVFVCFFARKPLMSQILLANYIMPYISRKLPNLKPALVSTLTRRELEVLKWAKEGKSYWETSVIMKVSERTVKFHLSNIYRKFNVVNRSQAIAMASNSGCLAPRNNVDPRNTDGAC